MKSINKINFYTIIGATCAVILIFMALMLDKSEFYHKKYFTCFVFLLGSFLVSAIVDSISKEKDKTKFKFRIISIPVFVIALVGFSIIIYKLQNGLMHLETAKWYGALFVSPIFLYYSVFSLITESAPARGLEIKLKDHPILYLILTVFYGLITFVIFLYIIVSINSIYT